MTADEEKKTILVIEDDLDVLSIIIKHLKLEGFEVIIATDGMEGLKKLETGHYDLVITDIVMPNMTGDKLAEKIIDIRSDIPVILCTGYSEKITRKDASEMGIQSFLMKPLVMRDLANTVRQALSAN